MKDCWIPRPEHPGHRRPQPVRADDVARPQGDVLPRCRCGRRRRSPGRPGPAPGRERSCRCAPSAPAATAASARIRSRCVRRGATSRSTPARSFNGRLTSRPSIPRVTCATGRGSRGEHFVQQPPAGQLDHSAAGQAVRREWVTEQVAALDHDHVVPTSRQQPRGRRSGAAAADDDDVVGGGPAGHARSCGRGQRGGAVVLERPTCSLRHRWHLTATWRAGGGQVVTGDLSVVTVRSGLRPGRARPPRSRRVPPRAGAPASPARAGSAARCRRCRR